LKFVREKINLTCQFAGRNPKDVKLLLATKTVPADRIKQALDAHQTLIGENKVQELQRVLHKELTKENRKLDILVQVNTSYEESKFGVAPEETLNLIEQLSELDTLNIKGLMTIGKLTTDDKETRECFRLLKSIRQQVIDQNYPGVEMDILSMGMSGDFEIAIEEGATLFE